jgi:2-amino-4-hydroxy-6-hydroxymethyldihydropteridine diphosphokinase
MHICYLSLGSNLGKKQANLELALQEIKKDVGEVLRTSCIYETEAWGIVSQDNYFNIIAEVSTPYFPLDVITKLLAIESRLGRIRDKKWESRIIDIDIIFYENYLITTDILIIPHPFLEKRNFVLEPLNELNPDFIHPRLRKSICQLTAECTDVSWIKKQ